MTLLRNRNFRRFFLAQFVSSLGDWVGVFAIAAFADRLGGATGVGTVLTARVLPGFVVGPLAGVIADRWDRKKTMVVADILRALIIFSLPFFPSLIYLVLASMLLESLTLVWGPAKDASLPNFVEPAHLTYANSMNLLAVYAPWPLASIVFALLTTLGAYLGAHTSVLEGLQDNNAALALWLDSGTFIFSAVMVSTLAIPTSVRQAVRLNFRQVKDDLVEGLKFVGQHKQVRPWILGIAFTFTAAGGVFSLGLTFVRQVLGAGERGFAFLVGFLATGMIIGLLSVGAMSKRIQKDVLFSGSILLLGAGLIGLASMNALNSAIAFASALGFFGGIAYSSAYSLMHETTTDELRGRAFSAAYTVIRIGTLVGLGLFPFIAGAIGSEREVPFGLVLQGTRTTLWLAGAVAIGGAALSMRAINARGLGPRTTPQGGQGYFVVFEGGEGSGKTTQMKALVDWLEARGREVVTTREPGGTPIGQRIRDLLLDPASQGMDDRTETLLYAADRAQHVSAVIKPALDAGKVVISDRFIDSSLAYQGVARGLGVDEVYRVNEWAIEGVVPDLVFFLRLDPKAGLRRVPSEPDRIEAEDGDFHERVGEAYAYLAKKFQDRFVILDANRSQADIHKEIVRVFEDRASFKDETLEAVRDFGPPGPPVQR
ncbi:MAG: dTMP kinase [Actinomycetota bacterium]|nr:dTMP kinase [Actinomycetota bacterium]